MTDHGPRTTDYGRRAADGEITGFWSYEKLTPTGRGGLRSAASDEMKSGGQVTAALEDWKIGAANQPRAAMRSSSIAGVDNVAISGGPASQADATRLASSFQLSWGVS